MPIHPAPGVVHPENFLSCVYDEERVFESRIRRKVFDDGSAPLAAAACRCTQLKSRDNHTADGAI